MGIIVEDTYTFAKCFLYLLLIGRLFDPLYRQIYEHSNRKKKVLSLDSMIDSYTKKPFENINV